MTPKCPFLFYKLLKKKLGRGGGAMENAITLCLQRLFFSPWWGLDSQRAAHGLRAYLTEKVDVILYYFSSVISSFTLQEKALKNILYAETRYLKSSPWYAGHALNKLLTKF